MMSARIVRNVHEEARELIVVPAGTNKYFPLPIRAGQPAVGDPVEPHVVDHQ